MGIFFERNALAIWFFGIPNIKHQIVRFLASCLQCFVRRLRVRCLRVRFQLWVVGARVAQDFSVRRVVAAIGKHGQVLIVVHRHMSVQATVTFLGVLWQLGTRVSASLCTKASFLSCANTVCIPALSYVMADFLARTIALFSNTLCDFAFTLLRYAMPLASALHTLSLASTFCSLNGTVDLRHLRPGDPRGRREVKSINWDTVVYGEGFN